MKRFLSITLFALILVLGMQQELKAADGDIELFPYDQEACLNAEPACTRTKVGDAHWDVSFNGYNYNVAGGQARYVADMSDDNSDGFIDATEMPTNSWSSFGGIIVNDTAEDIILKTANRTDLTGAVHRIYTYFDENGNLAMFEDHYVTKYYIFNDGTAIDPDWRLATQAEADVWDAADPKPDDTMYTTIRMALDDVDTDGYLIEPLASLAWVAQGVDVGVDAVADWSSIIADDPNYVYIPAGWTVVGFGTLDRDGSNAKTVDFIKTMPEALAANTAVMEMVYDDQPGWFGNLTAQDDDAGTPGINIVIDYNGAFNLPNDVTAEWLNMFDDTSGLIVNSDDMIDYSVTISEDGVDLETIDFVWNSGTTSYDPSAAVTAIDSSVFGAGYLATYTITTPEGDVTVETVDIVIGVMPPKFIGVEDVYVNEGTYINLLDGITADDGYANDKTSSIMVTEPVGFNTYYPQPGEYTIELEFTHHVHFDGEASYVVIDGTRTDWPESQLNSVTGLNVTATTEYAIFTDAQMAIDVGWAWGSLMVLVGADGLVDAVYDRYTWDIDDDTGAWVGDSVVFEAWKAALVIEPGGFVIGSHGSTISPALRALAYDSPVTFVDTTVATITIDGARQEWDPTGLNSATSLNPDASANYAIFTEDALVHDVAWSWGTVLVLVGADGLVDGVYDRYTWDVTDVTGEWNDGGTTFETWKAAIVIEEGGFVVGSHGGTISPALRALEYDDEMAFVLAAEPFDYDIVTTDSFVVTVDDITAPQAMVLNENYTVVVGEYATVNAAILANVVAFDSNDSVDDLAIYVSDNGTLSLITPNTYTVEVTVEDLAGNSVVVSFDVTVEAAPVIVTQAEIDAAIQAAVDEEVQALLDAQTITQAEIQALLDAQTITEAEIQALIDEATVVPDSGCGSSIALGSSIVLLIAAISGGGLFFIRRKR